jgi:uncharacterized OsmC-like protein
VAVDVDFDNRSTPRRCEIAVSVGAALDEAQVQRLERVARACPVRRSLEAGVEFIETIVCDSAAAKGPLAVVERAI